MAKITTKLDAPDRVILLCAGTGIDHVAVGILARAMQSMAIRGFIAHTARPAFMLSRTADVPRSQEVTNISFTLYAERNG